MSFDKLTLNFFLYPGGHHEAGWRYPAAERARLFDIRFYQDLAQAAEAAKFDAIFFADAPRSPRTSPMPPASASSRSPGSRRSRP